MPEQPDSLLLLQSHMWSFVSSKCLTVAVENDLFEIVERRKGMLIEDIATSLEWDTRATRGIVGVLEAIGCLSIARNNMVNLTATARKWLLKESAQSLRAFILRSGRLHEAYMQLDKIAKTGEPSPRMREETLASFGTNYDLTVDFAKSMHSMSYEFSEEVALYSKLDGAKSLMDVGCGWGSLAVALAKRWNNLSITAFDLPGVIEGAKKNVSNTGLKHQIHLESRDWLVGYPDGQFDAILLSQVLHEVPYITAEHLLKEAADHLKLGGLLLIVGFLDTGATPSGFLSSVFTLNMMVELGSDNPTEKKLTEKTAELGIQVVSSQPLSGGRTLWTGKKL